MRRGLNKNVVQTLWGFRRKQRIIIIIIIKIIKISTKTIAVPTGSEQLIIIIKIIKISTKTIPVPTVGRNS